MRAKRMCLGDWACKGGDYREKEKCGLGVLGAYTISGCTLYSHSARHEHFLSQQKLPGSIDVLEFGEYPWRARCWSAECSIVPSRSLLFFSNINNVTRVFRKWH